MIADGTEETECLAVVDILRRAGIDTAVVSIDGITVTSSHGIKITVDEVISQTDFSDADLLFIPGGMPGSRRMGECKPLIAAIKNTLKRGGRVAAICAAPALVLGANGFLRGVKATCFPDFETQMTDCVYSTERVATDGSITTARGLGCAIELGLELVRLLLDGGISDEIKRKIQF